MYMPRNAWERVVAEAAQTAEKRGEAICRKDKRDMDKAEVALRKHYPRIPSSDLEKVLSHAFLKGSGRVGRTSGQSLELMDVKHGWRAQLPICYGRIAKLYEPVQ